MRPRIRAGLAAAVVAVGTAAFACVLEAAETEFGYDAGIEELYAQDVLRVGVDAVDDYLTTLRLGAGLLIRTPRSQTGFRYAPESVRYQELDYLNEFNHRLVSRWRMQPGPLSAFEVRQGFTATTRQIGFQDFVDAGGNASEPVTARSRRVVWDLAPSLTVTPSPGESIQLEAIYREEGYDREELIDSRQVGVGGSYAKAVSRSYSLGGRLRADKFDFEIPGTLPTAGFDQFIDAQAIWSRTSEDRWSFRAAGGGYRASGPGLAPVTRPTLDLSSQWRLQRVYLLLSYELSYSTGGGISTSSRSQWGHLAATTTWGRGFASGGDVGYIYRAAPQVRLGDEVPLEGWSLRLYLSKGWQNGVGMTVGLQKLRQQRQVGPDLGYVEASIALTYTPPKRERRERSSD